MSRINVLPKELRFDITDLLNDLPTLWNLSQVNASIEDYVKIHAERLILDCCDSQPKCQLKGNIVAELLDPILPTLDELRGKDEYHVLSQTLYDAEDRWDEECSARISIRSSEILKGFTDIIRDVESLVEACCDHFNRATPVNEVISEGSLMLISERERRPRICKAIWKLRHFVKCTTQTAIEQHKRIETEAQRWTPELGKAWRPAAILAERTERLIHLWLGSPTADEHRDMYEVFQALLVPAEQRHVNGSLMHPSVLLTTLLKQQQVLTLWNISLVHWFEATDIMNQEEEFWSFWKAQGEVERLSSKQMLSVVELRVKRWKESMSLRGKQLNAQRAG